MNNYEYNRIATLEYAKKWAYSRNPQYYNFDPVGGDCTSFASQCIYAGTNVMNYKPAGWFYVNGNRKSPSWSGVEFLHNFLVNNKGVGPYGKIIEDVNSLEIGDIVQIAATRYNYTHSLVVVREATEIGNVLVAAHTYDAYEKPVSAYVYQKIRMIHIEGFRK